MKYRFNVNQIYISHKSTTCFSKDNLPLSYYGSEREAQESADYQNVQSGRNLIPYFCSTCGKYHLKPLEFYCPKTDITCSCTDHTGKSKAAYLTKESAERMVAIRTQTGVRLTVYLCPYGNGWHLTSNAY